MGKLLISHRSTAYPCYLPVLGRFAGAGRIRLTRDKSSYSFVMNGLLNLDFSKGKNVRFAQQLK